MRLPCGFEYLGHVATQRSQNQVAFKWKCDVLQPTHWPATHIPSTHTNIVDQNISRTRSQGKISPEPLTLFTQVKRWRRRGTNSWAEKNIAVILRESSPIKFPRVYLQKVFLSLSYTERVKRKSWIRVILSEDWRLKSDKLESNPKSLQGVWKEKTGYFHFIAVA